MAAAVSRKSKAGSFALGCTLALGFVGRVSSTLTLRSFCDSASVIFSQARLQPAPVFGKNSEASQSPFLQGKLHRGSKHPESVFHAAAEVDGRRLGKVFRRAGHFADLESKVNALRQHLIIKNKIIGIFEQWKPGQ